MSPHRIGRGFKLRGRSGRAMGWGGGGAWKAPFSYGGGGHFFSQKCPLGKTGSNPSGAEGKH